MFLLLCSLVFLLLHGWLTGHSVLGTWGCPSCMGHPWAAIFWGCSCWFWCSVPLTKSVSTIFFFFLKYVWAYSPCASLLRQSFGMQWMNFAAKCGFSIVSICIRVSCPRVILLASPTIPQHSPSIYNLSHGSRQLHFSGLKSNEITFFPLWYYLPMGIGFQLI